MIKRFYDNLSKELIHGKVLVITGPRQVGKTTLIRNFMSSFKGKMKYVTGENIRVQRIFSSSDLDLLGEFCEGLDLIAIDEANAIDNIVRNLKLITDNIPNIKIIISASSSFELSGQLGEPLTGRKKTIRLFPISFLELSGQKNTFDLKNTELNDALIFGLYPEIVSISSKREKIARITELAESYLLKDLLSFEKVKSSKLIFDLLKLLAFQIGSEVSLLEIGQKLGIDSKTVARYLDILEKSFILLNIRPFSGNLRNEITKKSKYYFYDNGIRNAIISNFNDLTTRDDLGKLWENFLVNERIKRQSYKNIHGNQYFWRTWEGNEVDYIEERGGAIHAFEFKYGRAKKSNKKFVESYPNATIKTITRDNFLDFVI
ncbi:MAG: ATP-binding protein [Vulcanibacillus sp.]